MGERRLFLCENIDKGKYNRTLNTILAFLFL